jgi:4-carboxymuconolactone decarboxylase
VGLSDDVLFGHVWQRPGLTPKEPSLVTVASLVTCGNSEALVNHISLAKQNGAAEEEITHLAFYVGWPHTMAAVSVAKPDVRES